MLSEQWHDAGQIIEQYCTVDHDQHNLHQYYTHEEKKVYRSIIGNKSNKIDVRWYLLDNNSTYTVNKLKITFVNLNDKYVMPNTI